MSTTVDADTGQVLGVVDGRDSTGVGAWLAAPPRAWLEAVEVVAIDPSAAFRKALRAHLPGAAVSVDAFHLVKLANDTVTAVRQRMVREHKGRRGRLVDPTWANRRLLLRGGELDPRCPPRQIREIAERLRARGRVCEYKVYADEGHEISGLENRIDYDVRTVEFLLQHTGVTG